MDLASPNTYAPAFSSKGAYYVFCNNFGNIDFCKSHPSETRAINVDAIRLFLKNVKANDGIPFYLSSNMVFPGDKRNYIESDFVRPTTEYGHQKSLVEKIIQKDFNQFTIIRMTKVYDTDPANNSFFSSWYQSWKNDQKISAICDSFIAPIYIKDVIKIIELLIANKQFGIFHLSGPETKSYFEFAMEFASFLNIPSKLIGRVSSVSLGLQEKRPLYNSLSTQKIETTFPDISFTKATDVFCNYTN